VKLGTENRTKTILAAVLVVLAPAMLYRWLSGSGEEGESPSAGARAPVSTTTNTADQRTIPKSGTKGRFLAQTLDPTLRFDLLQTSEEVTYKGSGRDIFRSQAEPAPIPKPLPPDKQPKPVYTPPPPPPINLKFYGFAGRKDGYKRIFLSQGEDIFVAKEGDIVDRRYRIVKINANSVDVEDVLTNNRQTLPLTAG